MTEGFCKEETAGVPLGIVQFQDVGVLVELSVSVMDCPVHSAAEAVKFAVGALLLVKLESREVLEHPNEFVTTTPYDPLETAV